MLARKSLLLFTVNMAGSALGFLSTIVIARWMGAAALGTLGYGATGTLLAAIAVNTRAREVMLPILLLPLAVPVLIAAVQDLGHHLGGTRQVGVAQI